MHGCKISQMDAFRDSMIFNFNFKSEPDFQPPCLHVKESSKVQSPPQLLENSFRHLGLAPLWYGTSIFHNPVPSKSSPIKKNKNSWISCFPFYIAGLKWAANSVSRANKKKLRPGEVWDFVNVSLEFCWTFCRILQLQIVCWPEHDSSAQWVQADWSAWLADTMFSVCAQKE